MLRMQYMVSACHEVGIRAIFVCLELSYVTLSIIAELDVRTAHLPVVKFLTLNFGPQEPDPNWGSMILPSCTPIDIPTAVVLQEQLISKPSLMTLQLCDTSLSLSSLLW